MNEFKDWQLHTLWHIRFEFLVQGAHVKNGNTLTAANRLPLASDGSRKKYLTRTKKFKSNLEQLLKTYTDVIDPYTSETLNEAIDKISTTEKQLTDFDTTCSSLISESTAMSYLKGVQIARREKNALGLKEFIRPGGGVERWIDHCFHRPFPFDPTRAMSLSEDNPGRYLDSLKSKLLERVIRARTSDQNSDLPCLKMASTSRDKILEEVANKAVTPLSESNLRFVEGLDIHRFT